MTEFSHDDQHDPNSIPTIIFVTSNASKLNEVRDILSPDIRVINEPLDVIEIQGSVDEVALAKCKAAASILQKPVLTEDTCLSYDAFGGLPGPYVKDFLRNLKPEGLYKMLNGFDDHRGTAICTVAYCHGPNETPILFKGEVRGTIVPPRGSKDFGWSPIFLPDGYDQTFAEMSKETKNTMSHRAIALNQVRRYFLEK